MNKDYQQAQSKEEQGEPRKLEGTPSRYFIFDDDGIRRGIIRKHIKTNIGKNVEIIEADTLRGAKSILMEFQPFEILFLDHDLEWSGVLEEIGENGFQVAEFIVSENIRYKKCIIHSLNYTASKQTRKLLGHRAMCVPFLSAPFLALWKEKERNE